MGSKQEAGGSLSPELAVVLDAQRNAILTAVNAQIQRLQTNLLQAQSNLAVQIASDLTTTRLRRKETSSSLVSIIKWPRRVIQH